MTTWQSIFGVDPPIRGDVAQFDGARRSFESMESDARSVQAQFTAFGSPAFVEGHLNDKPGAMVQQVLSEIDDGLDDLPNIAEQAKNIFAAHHGRLVDLHDAADEALARARTAWDRKNDLLDQQAQLQSQIGGLQRQIDDAPAGADTSTIDNDLSGAASSLGGVNSELDSVQGTLDGIYGNTDSEHAGLVSAENGRNRETVDALHAIDLGDLDDPNWLEKAGGAVLGFLGGLLESIANCLEALVTGDFATFFWELKGLLDVALLVLGTIALFTGVGAPLFALAVANFAITAALWATETPNPQTGKKMGLLDVGMSALGVVMSSAGFLRTVKGVNGWNLFTRQAVRTNGPGGRFVYTATGARMPGAISQMRTSLGYLNQIRTAPVSAHSAMRGLSTFSKSVPYYGATGYAANPLVRTAMNADVMFTTMWQARGALGGIHNFVPAALPSGWDQATGSKGLSGTGATLTSDFSGFNYHHGFGNGFEQGTPMFGGRTPSRSEVLQVVHQIRQSPDVVIRPIP